MSPLSTRVELSVPPEVAGTVASLLRARTGAHAEEIEPGRVVCDLREIEPDLPDAVGGWLAGMGVEGASVRTGTVGSLTAGWPTRAAILGGWLHLNCPLPAGAPAHAVSMVFDPGLCFGSGWHPTTRNCAEVIGGLAAADLAGARVLDVGCGSGLFAVALAQRGAHVTAVDRWATAVERTAENAHANGVSRRVDARVGDARDIDTDGFDGIVANLAPCAGLAPLLVPMTRGWIALAGLQVTQIDAVLTSYGPLRETNRCVISHWVSLGLRASEEP